jgi:steroid delta-isomerase-like uncharacterized protein
MTTNAAAQRFFDEVWNEGRLEVVDELFAPEYVGHPSGPEQTVRGPEGVKAYVASLRAGVPDLTVTIEDQVADGAKVATRWTAHGTHSGELLGIQPTGLPATVTGITVQRIGDAGQIVEGWTNWDMLGMLQQLGAAPPRRVEQE